MTLTTFALSIAVNILVTGLILFKIVKVSLAAKAFTTSGGTKLQHVIFVIIESGMTLLAIQLARITLYFLQTHYNSEKVNDVIRKSYGETARCVAIHTEKDTTLE